MKTLRMVIDLTYDEQVMHADDPGAIRWFNELLNHPDGKLMLYSSDLGDHIGEVEVVGRSTCGLTDKE